jgi:MtN3 and saliva related transmembrane protein
VTALDALGLVAGACTTLGFVPQVWRVFQLKSAREISLSFTLFFLGGMVLWLWYSLRLSLLPMILWNSLTLFLGVLLLYAKVRYGRRGRLRHGSTPWPSDPGAPTTKADREKA